MESFDRFSDPRRALIIPGHTGHLELPCFFPSISSVKGEVRPLHSLQILNALQVTEFLISAYDIHHASPQDRPQFEELLRSCLSRGATVLLDSGKYESFWRSDYTWSHSLFAEIVSSIGPSLRFCFDDQDPPFKPADAAQRIIAICRQDQVFHSSPVAPIVHGLEENLPTTCRIVALELNPLLIAVPERELGDGIINRARTLWRIRRSLDNCSIYTPLHLLGTGHPVSMLIVMAEDICPGNMHA